MKIGKQTYFVINFKHTLSVTEQQGSPIVLNLPVQVVFCLSRVAQPTPQ